MSSDKFPFAQVAPFSPYRANYSPQSASLIDAQEMQAIAVFLEDFGAIPEMKVYRCRVELHL